MTWLSLFIARRLGVPQFVVKLIVYAVIVGALLATYQVWHSRVYWQGVNDTLVGIETDNAEGRRTAEDIRAKIDQCYDRGGMWDVRTQSCHLE